ncbi:MAG: DHH family phosphoesterase [Candidatus Gracilibacteria bacterium]|nr:DHH family phosphoesterase [Candidatus Gracilibacteria bacterium]
MSEMQQEIRKIREIISQGQNFLVMGHRNVDGDAYGSSMALYFYLKNLGKTVEIVNEANITPLFHFLDCHTLVTQSIQGQEFDAIFVCDCGELELLGKPREDAPDIFKNTPLVNIDHHNGNKLFGDYDLVDTGASSTCEILCNLLENTPLSNSLLEGESTGDKSDKILPTPLSPGGNYISPLSFGREVGGEGSEEPGGGGGIITPQIATLLLFGIIRDTNCFKNSIRPRTFEVTSELIALGADYEKIIFHTYKSEKLNYLKLYGHVLDTLISLKGGSIIGGYISQDTFKQYGIPENELGPQLINEILSSLDGSDFAFLIKETEDGNMKLSLRARKNTFNVSKIARHFGGGGHIFSAGAYTDKTLSEILRVIEEMDVRM